MTTLFLVSFFAFVAAFGVMLRADRRGWFGVKTSDRAFVVLVLGFIGMVASLFV